MRLSATDETSGCLKLTVPSAEMLNFCQFRIAEFVVCVMSSVFPVLTTLAPPDVMNAVFGPHVPPAQGTGSSAACAPHEPTTSAALTALSGIPLNVYMK